MLDSRKLLFALSFAALITFAISLLFSFANAAIVTTSNGTISVDATSGTISQDVQAGQDGSQSTLSITFSAASNSSNSSSSDDASIDTPAAVAASNQTQNATSAAVIPVVQAELSLNFSSIAQDTKMQQQANASGVPVTTISFISNVTRENVSFAIKAWSARPLSTVELLNTAYSYFEISKSNVQNYEMRDIVVSFKVSKSWIQAQGAGNADVILKRYTLDWDDVSTRFVQELGGDVYYEADLPGFSYFAIVTKRAGSNSITGAAASGAAADSEFQLLKKDSGLSAGAGSPVRASPLIIIMIIAIASVAAVLGYQKLADAGVVPSLLPAGKGSSTGAAKAAEANRAADKEEAIIPESDLDLPLPLKELPKKSPTHAKGRDKGYDVSSVKPDSPLPPLSPLLNQVASYVDFCYKMGYTEEQMRMALTKVGWHQDIIVWALKHAEMQRKNN